MKVKGSTKPASVTTISLVTGSPTPAPTAAPAPKTGQSQTLPMPPAASIKGDGHPKTK